MYTTPILPRIYKLICQVVFLAHLMPLLACGGGTQGTGGDQLSGQVLDSSDKPISNIVVVVQSSGDSDVTDEDGRFAITTSLPTDDFDLAIQSDKSSATVSVPVASKNPSSISLKIQFDEERGEAELSEVNESESEENSLGSAKRRRHSSKKRQ